MTKEIIYAAPELDEVSYQPNLEAVVLKSFSEWDEGSGVKDVVWAALNHVCRHDVKHWLADLSTSRRGLTPKDQEWVASDEFRDAIVGSPLRKFVLIPPGPETGQDVSWLAEWEANTLANFGDAVDAKLSGGQEEIRSFSVGRAHTEKDRVARGRRETSDIPLAPNVR